MANDKKQITEEMYKALQKPLPAKAVQKHPTKTFLSTIKAIYVIERLNEVFGVGMWKVQNKVIREDSKHIVVKSCLTFEEYLGYFESYGGNDNADLGDAYKGACTDALTKIGSYLGVAMEVFKGEGNTEKQETKQPAMAKVATAKAAIQEAVENTSPATDAQKEQFKELLMHDAISHDVRIARMQQLNSFTQSDIIKKIAGIKGVIREYERAQEQAA